MIKLTFMLSLVQLQQNINVIAAGRLVINEPVVFKMMLSETAD